ncbi:MAG: hypothetical protein KJO55_02900 [Gammaproteobacteria bacterium]|nr:hypothetical protein [Gammaproteobacteria bacterium]NND59516.1 hypothetical protein [Gammaproteobacteria bacterium]
MNMRVYALTMALAVSVSHAEISGSGSPNAFCGSARVAGSVIHEISGSGIHGVAVDLSSEDLTLTAVTGQDGEFEFLGLCEGDHHIDLDLGSIPEGLTLTSVTVPDEADFDDEGWQLEIDDSDSDLEVIFRLQGDGMSRCAINVEAGCHVASLATELYQCSKRVNSLRMTWVGTQDVRVRAYNGKPDDPLVAEFDLVSPGETIEIPPMDNPPDDVIWEIFDIVSGDRLGESKFRLACDDEEMNGPEDCGVLQGNGKDNKSELINAWQFSGLTDSSGLVDCTPASYTEVCSFNPERVDCDVVDKVFYLTFVFQGGDCATSQHHQPGKFQCNGQINSSQPVTVATEDDELLSVEPGGVFTVAKDGSDTELELWNDGGLQQLKIHTSCSEPLAVNDSYGALRLVAINGRGVAAPVDFEYQIANVGDGVISSLEVGETGYTLADTEVDDIDAGVLVLMGSGWATGDMQNTFVAVGADAFGECGADADMVTATVSALENCEVSEVEREIHDKEIRWTLSSGPATAATIQSIEVSWPEGKLKEAALNGDKFFDTDITGGNVVIDAALFEGELKRRKLLRNDLAELKIKFDEDIENADDYAVTVTFEQGCSIQW